MKQRIIVRWKSISSELGVYAFEEKLDGSFYIFINREGHSRKSWNYGFNTTTAEVIDLKELRDHRSKSTKISYHSSGRINYQKDNLNEHIIYANPITQINSPFTICTYSIPKLSKLNQSKNKQKNDDLIINFPNKLNGRVNFSFIIAPWNTIIPGKIVSLSVKFRSLFSFHIVIDRNEIPIPIELKNTFVTMKPEKGLYNNQLISEHQATLNFQHRMNQTNDLIIYSPNKEGIYKVFYAVPMRIPPSLSVQFTDPKLQIEMIGKHTEVYLSFKVYRKVNRENDKKKQYVKTEQPIKRIALYANL